MPAPHIVETAQQVATAVIIGADATAEQIAHNHPHPAELALVLATLVDYVHRRWCHTLAETTGIAVDPPATWALLMADIEEWRATK